MSNGLPPVLYRCWSTKSAGDLRSRKVRNGVRPHHFTQAELLQEFQQHRNLYARTPTAFVSTTSDFIRALHIAYQKIPNEKDARNVKIAFLTTETDPRTRIYHAKNLAIGGRSSEEEANKFKNEYIFLWEVPDDNVIHVISMDLVIERGFALPGLHVGRPLPSSSDLRRAIVDHGNQLSLFERGYLCGTAACMFGVRAPVYNIASDVSCWGRGRPYIVDQAIEEAIQDRKITVAEGLGEQGEPEHSILELSCLEDTHDDAVMEIGWRLQNCHDVEDLQALLTNEQLKIAGDRQRIAARIEFTYQSVGL